MGPSTPDDAVADRLRAAELEVVGRFATASNATLLVRLRRPGGRWPELPLDDDGDLMLTAVPADAFAVYKPRQGEAPLWDFPEGTLYRREVAAFEVDRLLGWGLVPTTVVRQDAPYGVGAVQAFVPHDPERHYFALLDSGETRVLDQLRRMVLFDLVIDNADRKAGHVLEDPRGRIRLVDHGVSFHVQPKLRTVAWDFAGTAVDPSHLAAVAHLTDLLETGDGRLPELLTAAEHARLVTRAREVARLTTFPQPTGPRPYPWPLL